MSQIELVDAPDMVLDVPADEISYRPEESQRTYKIHGDKVHTVRIRFDFDKGFYAYVIENLVGGKWHRLLEGETTSKPGGYGREPIPFEAAAERAAKVLLDV